MPDLTDVESLILKCELNGTYHGSSNTQNKSIKAVVEALFQHQQNSTKSSEYLAPAQRMVPFLAQVSHETAGYRYDREIWGPTDQQLKYDPASGSSLSKTLGNVTIGDGKKYSGLGPFMLTGKGNVTKFWNWATSAYDDVPNFVEKPEYILVSPWFGLSAIWFWNVGNRTGRSLNVYADIGNFEQITRVINGGLNGYEDRCHRYTKYGLVLLGWPDASVNSIKQFQKKNMGHSEVDGIAGARTRAAIHAQLVGRQVSLLPPVADRAEGEPETYFGSWAGESFIVNEYCISLGRSGDGDVIIIPRVAFEKAMEMWGYKKEK